MEDNSGHWPATRRDALIRSRAAEWMRYLQPALAIERFLLSEIRHKTTHSEVILRVSGKAAVMSERFLLVVPFPESVADEASIAPSKVFRFDTRSRQWQRITIPKTELEEEKSYGRPLTPIPGKLLSTWLKMWPTVRWMLLPVIMIFGVLIIASPLRDTFRGLQSLFWVEAEFVRDAKGFSYVNPADGQKIEIGHPSYTVATVERDQEEYHKPFEKSQGWWAFKHHKPTVVYFNPSEPKETVLVNGIPPQSSGLLIGMSFVLLLGFRFLIDLLRKKFDGQVYLIIPLAHLLSLVLYLGMAWAWSFLVFVPMPGWPALLWFFLLSAFELIPGLWTWAISHGWFNWSLRQLIIIVLLPLGIAGFGLGLPFVLAFFVAVLILIVLFSAFKPSAVLQNIIRLLWMPFYIAGVLAVFRALCLFAYMLLPGIPYHMPTEYLGDITMVSRFDLCVGAAGILVALITTFLDTFWRIRQARQVSNLATSKAGSAARGIAEFRGKAASIDGSSDPVISFTMPGEGKVEPFYLLDDSGRILIDPRGSHFRFGRASSFGGRLNEIVLKKRMTRPLLTRPLSAMLLSGDEFYVIGNVMRNPEVPPGTDGPDALVVKPLVEPGITNTFISILLGKTQIPAARDIQHVFFLSDGSEQEARRYIMKGLGDIWCKAFIVIMLCTIMISLQEPRATGGRDTWTLGEMLQINLSQTRRVTYVIDALLREQDDRPPKGWLRDAVYFRELLEIKDKTENVDASNYLWINVRTDAYWSNAPDLFRLYEKSSSQDMRRFAVWALGRVRPQTDLALPILLHAVKEPDTALRMNALESLPKVMPYTNPEVLKAQLAAAQDADVEVVRLALFSLRETKGLPVAEVLPVVMPLLSHKEGYVRHEAANFLAHLKEGALPAIDMLRQALHDSENIVRNSAAVAIKNIGPAAAVAVPDLIAMLRMSGNGNSMFAAEALGRIGPRAADAVPDLIQMLGSTDQWARSAAAETLGRIGPAAVEAVQALEKLADDRNESVRNKAYYAIKSIQGKIR